METYDLVDLALKYDVALKQHKLQKREELALLIEFLRPFPLKTVVEIGSATGGTLVVWSMMGLEDASIISIDTSCCEELQKTRRFLLERNPRQRIELITGNSHYDDTKKRLEQVLGRSEIDLLFVDGEHYYQAVKMDYEMYQPLVRDGGWIAFHDILQHREDVARYVQVEQFWHQVCEGKSTEDIKRFVDESDVHGPMGLGPWGGIGLIRNRR